MNPPIVSPDKPVIKTKLWMSSKLLALCLLLVIACVVMLFLWRPWQANIKASTRTISVTGTATIYATPDQFVFDPTYTYKGTDQQSAITSLSQQSNTIVSHLEGLGVPSKDISSNSNGYNNYGPFISSGNSSAYELDLEVTVNGSSLAQKVQNYILTTSPTGGISPVAQFSTSLQQKLQNQARTKAEQNARSQAEQSAGNLGFSVGAVKSVDDTNDNNNISPGPYEGISSAAGTSATASPKLNIQPGQNELDYSVTVVYFIK